MAAAAGWPPLRCWPVWGCHRWRVRRVDRTFFTDSDTYMVAVAVVASGVAAVSARMARGRMRRLGALVVGLLGFAVGSAIWPGYVLTRRIPPYPSVADAAYP